MKRLVLFVLLAACGSARPVPVPATPARTVVLLPSDTLSPSFVAQQRLHGRYGEREFTLDCVLQVVQGKLTLVGLTPFNTRAFVLTQVGTEVTLEKFIDRELPFDPRYVLDDIQRVFFRSVPGAQADGTSQAEADGERITETRTRGMPTVRRFARVDGQPRGEIVVTFKGEPSPVIAPEVTLENGWFGYTLRVVTSTQQLVN